MLWRLTLGLVYARQALKSLVLSLLFVLRLVLTKLPKLVLNSWSFSLSLWVAGIICLFQHASLNSIPHSSWGQRYDVGLIGVKTTILSRSSRGSIFLFFFQFLEASYVLWLGNLFGNALLLFVLWLLLSHFFSVSPVSSFQLWNSLCSYWAL